MTKKLTDVNSVSFLYPIKRPDVRCQLAVSKGIPRSSNAFVRLS